MERIPEVVQLTDMWESDDESGEDGVGDGQVELRGNEGGGGAAEDEAATEADEAKSQDRRRQVR